MEVSPVNIKVSLITVTYNAAETVGDTIRSVLNQSHQDIEYILVDGASKDNTVDIIQSFAQTDDRIKWISEADKGLYDAMNKGIAMASGDIVGILNADDFFKDESSLRKIVDAFAADRSIDAVYGNVLFVSPDNLSKIVRKYSSRIFRPWLFRFGFMPAHATFYCKRDLFERFGYYKLGFKIAADFELLLRFILVHKIRTSYLPEFLVTMRTGGVSTKNLNSKIVLNSEIVKACQMNGVYTNAPLLMLKYAIKVFELR